MTLKKLFFNIYYCFAFVVVSIIGIVLLPWILLVNVIFIGRSVNSALRRAIRFYGWVLVCVVPFMSPVTVESQTDRLHFPAILVANHNSAIDPYLFGALPIENVFVTTWPFKIPVYNLFMRLAGYINAGNGWDEVRRQGAELLRSGCSVTIWPEGHRSRDGRIRRFKKGAFLLAAETGYPVIPVCILGSGQILPPGKRFFSQGRIRMILLDPVYPDRQGDRQQQAVVLRDKARLIIEKTFKENNGFLFNHGILANFPKTTASENHG